MNYNLSVVKQEIIRALIELNNSEWEKTHLVFAFPPYLNKGWTGSQLFTDSKGIKIRLSIFGDDKFNNTLYDFINHVKKESNHNQIVFSAERNKLEQSSISLEFNQEIEDNFQNNLPKSKRGKTIPWWKQNESY